jgi:type IV secretory pathway TrbD component
MIFGIDLRVIFGLLLLAAGIGVVLFFVASVIVRAVRKSRD